MPKAKKSSNAVTAEYVVLKNLRHNQKHYYADQFVDLAEEDALPLLAIGVVRPKTVAVAKG